MSEGPDADSSPVVDQVAVPDAKAADDPDSTAGTGTVLAIGCTVLMMIILIIGIAIFISRQAN